MDTKADERALGGGRMTEHKCGSAKSCKYGDMCKPNFNIGACSHYKAEEPHTNDEWRKTCSAEEFAEFLCNVGFENETIVRKFKSEWAEWLKQPHK